MHALPYGVSLSMAEQVGDIPLICVVRGNIGVLAMRLGELIEAEDYFKQGIELAERINDPIYMSILKCLSSCCVTRKGKLPRGTKKHTLCITCRPFSAHRSMYWNVTYCIRLHLCYSSYTG